MQLHPITFKISNTNCVSQCKSNAQFQKYSIYLISKYHIYPPQISTFKTLIHGSIPNLQLYVTIQILIFILLILTASLFYELNYYFGPSQVTPLSPFYIQFSNLGDFTPNANPSGWIFFSLALWEFGLLFIPLIAYIHNRMSVISKALARISSVLYSFAVLFFILVGAFPSTSTKVFGNVELDDLHQPCAGFAVGLPVFALANNGLTLCRDWYKMGMLSNSGRRRFNLPRIRIPIIVLNAELIFGWTMILIWYILSGNLEGSGIFNFNFWEWTTIWTLLACLSWFIIALPTEVPM